MKNTTEFMKRYKKHLLPIVLYVSIGILILRIPIFFGGGVITPDIPYSVDSFVKIYLSTNSWSEQLGRPHSIQELYLGIFLLPFLTVSSIFGFSMFQTYMMIILTSIILSGIAMYFLSYFLLRNYEKGYKITILCSFISGLIYMSNPSYMIGDVQRYSTILGYAIFPLIVLSFIKAIDENKIYLGIISAVLTFYTFVFDFRYVASAIIFYFLYFIFRQIRVNRSSANDLKMLSITLIMLLAFFLSTIFSWYSGKGVFTDVPLSKNAIDIPWNNAQFVNILRGMSFMSIPNSYSNFPLQISDSYVTIITFIIPIFAFLSIFFNPKNRKVIFFTLIAAIFLIIFSSKSFVYWLMLDAPLTNFIGRMFRTTRIVDLFISISYGILIGFSLLYVVNKIKNKLFAIMIFSMLIISVVITSWPLMTGNINGKFISTDIPGEYIEANNWINTQHGDYKIIWIPEFFSAYQPLWANGSADNILTYSSSRPTYMCQDRLCKQYLDYTVSLWYNSLLNKNDLNNMANFLSNIDIKYLVLHNDTKYLDRKVDSIIEKMKNSTDFELVKQINFIYIFENKRYINQKIFIPSKNILVSGGLETGKNILNILKNDSNMSYKNYGIFYIDEEKDIGNDLEIFDTIVMTNSKTITDLMVPFIDKENIVIPFDYSKEYDPNNKWSKGLLTDSHHAVWHNYINAIDSQKWEFSNELNYGYIFTTGEDKLDIPLITKKDERYNILFRILKSPNGGMINIYLDKKRISSINTLNNHSGEFVWYDISNIDIDKGNHFVSIKNIKGFNAINIGLFIPTVRYENIRQMTIEKLYDKNIIYHVEPNALTYLFGNNDTAVLNIYPFIANNYSIFFINKEKLSDISKYQRVYLQDNVQEIVMRNIYINLAKNTYKNLDNIAITKNFSISIDCKNKINDKCSYKIETKTRDHEWSWLRKDINVAPEKIYRIITYMKWENANQSHIALDAYDEGKNSYYRIMNIPDGNVGVGTSNWKEFSTLLKVPKGVKKLSFVFNAGWVGDVPSGNATTWFGDIVLYDTKNIDSILLSDNKNITLSDIFSIKAPALVLNYTKLGPTLYRVRVDATKPFILSLTESYDPLWNVKIDKIDGKSAKSNIIHPIPLYSMINGFWINQTGNLDIIIEYESQKWFYIGTTISIIALIISFVYLIYDWRRDKKGVTLENKI